MPRAPKEVKRPACRPKLDIDWKRVDKWLMSGCPGTKIANAIGVCANTLYDRCEQEYGVSFSIYSQQKRECGDANLHEAQYDNAIGGDTTLLIFLGKTRLDQKENQEISVAPETVKALATVMSQLDKLQEQSLSQKEIAVPVDPSFDHLSELISDEYHE